MFKTNPIVLANLFAALASADDCSFFQGLSCTSGSQTTNPSDWVNRSFQTPLPNSPNHKDGMQGYGRVVCYNHIQYNSARTSAEVTATCRKHDSITKMEYNWNGAGFTSSATFNATSSLTEALSLTVKATDAAGVAYTIDLESPNFIWQNPIVNQSSVYENGQKGGIVELFGWPHADVEAECASLGKMGWMGVKIFPVMESVWSNEWP